MSESSTTKVRIKRLCIRARNSEELEKLINEELDKIDCLYITNIQCVSEKTALDFDLGISPNNVRIDSVLYVTYVVEDIPS